MKKRRNKLYFLLNINQSRNGKDKRPKRKGDAKKKKPKKEPPLLPPPPKDAKSSSMMKDLYILYTPLSTPTSHTTSMDKE